MWELVTGDLVLLKGQSLDTISGLDFCRQEGCGESCRQIRMAGPCAWPFREMPTPVRRDLCV